MVMLEKYEEGSYPGMCFGDYDPDAVECRRCDLRRECELETGYDGRESSGADDGGSSRQDGNGGSPE